MDRTLQLYTVDPQIRATGRDDIDRPLRDRYAEAVRDDLACHFTVFARLQAKFSAREIHLVMREEGTEGYGIAFLLRTTSSMAVGVVEGQAFMIEGMTPVASLMGLPTFSLSGQASMVRMERVLGSLWNPLSSGIHNRPPRVLVIGGTGIEFQGMGTKRWMGRV